MDPRFDPTGGSATQRRDDELRVLARTRRLIVIVSVAATAAIAGVVAQVKPGRSSASTSDPGTSGSTRGAAPAVTGSVARPLPPLSSSDVAPSSSHSTLAPPPQAPAPAPAPAPSPPVVSGGS